MVILYHTNVFFSVSLVLTENLLKESSTALNRMLQTQKKSYTKMHITYKYKYIM